LADDCGGARLQVHSICLLKEYVTEIFGIQVPELKKPNASAVTPAAEPAAAGEAQSTPWPADGTTLDEALWRVVDRQAVDREASDEHRASVEENLALGVATHQFCDLMQSGRYRATGRRGSPTAEHSEIPRTAWPYLEFIRWRDSLLIESKPSSVVWYDVRVWPMNAEPTTAARPAPERPAPGAAGRQPRLEPPPVAAPAEPPAAPVVAPKGIELPSQEQEPAASTPPDPMPPAERRKWQRDRVTEVLKEKLYPPDGRAPASVSTALVRKQVIKAIEPEWRKLGIGDPSWDTVNRALGRA
jgi:hypothetical protein